MKAVNFLVLLYKLFIINLGNKGSSLTKEQILDKLKEKFGMQIDYQFFECNYRNLVILGRTRTGKSTISSMIKDPFYIPPLPSLFACTREITFDRVTTNHNGDYCFFTIIDSPGLYDKMRNEGEHLTNETIKRYIDQCMTRDITHIHAFAFVFSSGSGINIEDIQSMIFIQKQYPELGNFFMLIITHCEEKDEDEQNKFLDEFFQHPDVIKNNLREFFGLGVFFTGTLRPQLARTPNMLSAQEQEKNVLKMRRKLLDFLVSRKETFNIHYTPITSTPITTTPPTPKTSSCCSKFFIFAVIVVVFAVLIFSGKK